LVANAVHHGATGSSVTVRVDGTRMDQVRVDVHNVGHIPADDLPRLFEPMTGVPRRDKSQGLGLGLFISQQILKAHGGRIDVRSAETGTTFTVSLPREAPNQETAQRR
jgi:signal transduction histidine kinase